MMNLSSQRGWWSTCRYGCADSALDRDLDMTPANCAVIECAFLPCNQADESKWNHQQCARLQSSGALAGSSNQVIISTHMQQWQQDSKTCLEPVANSCLPPLPCCVCPQGRIKGSYNPVKIMEFCMRGTMSSTQLLLGIDHNLPYLARQVGTPVGVCGRQSVLFARVHEGFCDNHMLVRAVLACSLFIPNCGACSQTPLLAAPS